MANLPAILFYVFAALAVICAFLVVANPFSSNPVTSAMFLVLSIGWLAGLYLLLHAFFLAAVQILVYAGAVMVLFLFVIMLLDLKAEERRRIKIFNLVGGVIAVGILAAIFLGSLMRGQSVPMEAPIMEGGTRDLGELLFSRYLLPFEIVSVLLLVAMLGTILLSKRELK